MDADGKKMESKTKSSELSGSSSQTRIQFLIMWCCLFIAWLLFYLPHEHKNESRVPALMLFTAHPSLFLALVIAVMLSFAGASGSLMLIGNKAGRVAKIRKCYSIMSFVSISSALSILAFALFLESFSWVSSGIFNPRQLNEDEADSFFVFSYVIQIFRKMSPVPFLVALESHSARLDASTNTAFNLSNPGIKFLSCSTKASPKLLSCQQTSEGSTL